MYSFPAWMGFATFASFIMLAVGNAWAFWKTIQKIKGIEACCAGQAAAGSTAAALAAIAKLKQGLDAAKTIDEAKEYVEKHLAAEDKPTAIDLDKKPAA